MDVEKQKDDLNNLHAVIQVTRIYQSLLDSGVVPDAILGRVTYNKLALALLHMADLVKKLNDPSQETRDLAVASLTWVVTPDVIVGETKPQ